MRNVGCTVAVRSIGRPCSTRDAKAAAPPLAGVNSGVASQESRDGSYQRALRSSPTSASHFSHISECLKNVHLTRPLCVCVCGCAELFTATLPSRTLGGREHGNGESFFFYK